MAHVEQAVVTLARTVLSSALLPLLPSPGLVITTQVSQREVRLNMVDIATVSAGSCDEEWAC